MTAFLNRQILIAFLKFLKKFSKNNSAHKNPRNTQYESKIAQFSNQNEGKK